jgi:hypothetical protein
MVSVTSSSPNCAVPQQTPPPEPRGRLTTTTADFFVHIYPSQPSATDDTALHALVARLNGVLGGLGSVASARTDPTGSYELSTSSSLVGAWRWSRS